MRRYRVGIFSRETVPTDGGGDTLLRSLRAGLVRLDAGKDVELVEVPWSAWSHRRRPMRYLWSRVVRRFGAEIPLVDLRPLCRRLRLDAAYFPAPAFVHIDIPFAFTVWDLGHRTIPEFPEMRSGRDPWTQREAMYARMLGQASMVITGNATGAAEITGFYGVEAARLAVIPFPNPDFTAVTTEVPSWLPAAPFFVYPAQMWPHKNHATLLRALALMATDGGAVPDLVFTGSDKGVSAHLEAMASALGVRGRVRFAGFVSRGELKALYERAVGLVFPSLLGPNNLPPQEAAVTGCPMVVSDLAGHREQLGEAALYAAPFDEHAWAAGMRRLMVDGDLRRVLAERARDQVAGFTKDAYAARLGPIIMELVGKRRLWP